MKTYRAMNSEECQQIINGKQWLKRAKEFVFQVETFEKYSSVSKYDPSDRLNLFVVPVALPPFSEMAFLGQPRVESLVF